eukprot:CAMPEP_0183722130 /NCGR_PEP_ID=MMETSP0737-20130205/14186_1 /TAXON_ID=385413 /ORGANISM="Thalassiosira miniscula, Strain CCMP1093" /LENGTH=133 /DNA_ID=CAMNT_0025952243 /DNA_START=82 /DNA_END=479 /DNA_ORIENTATION=+
MTLQNNNHAKNSTTSFRSGPFNNVFDPTNRISKIKRSREYQRQQLLDNKITFGMHLWNYKYDVVIGVLDLDLFAYPTNIGDVVETAWRYIVPRNDGNESNSDKFHAICANGIQVSKGRRSYYDTFSTILLPDA